MFRPGDTATLPVTVRVAAGTPVTGLVAADFAPVAYNGTTLTAISLTVTEIGSGNYLLSFALPGTAGWYSQFNTMANPLNLCTPAGFFGVVETQDMASLYALMVRPAATLAPIGTLASPLNLSVIANRYLVFSIAVTDQSGAPVDLSGYSNWKFSVWDKTHTTTIYTLTSGITGSNLGIVAWTVPSGASFNAQIDAQIAGSNDSLTLYYDVVADLGGVAGETQTILNGTFTLNRYETAHS